MSRNSRALALLPRVNLFRVGLALALLLCLGLPSAWAQDAPIKIAVVDLERVVANSQLGKQLQTQLEKFQQDAQAEGQVIQNAANEIRRRVSEGGNSLTEDKLAELQKEYEDKQIELRRFRDDKQREGQKIQAEGLREIEQQLEPIFKQVRDENGYDLIFNNVPGVVVMANDRVDITQVIIDRINKQQSGG